jgi:hypothetical protein
MNKKSEAIGLADFFIKIPKHRIFVFFFLSTLSNLGLAYGFLSKNPRFPFAIHNRWKKVLDVWVDRFFYRDLLKFTIRKSLYFICPQALLIHHKSSQNIRRL